MGKLKSTVAVVFTINRKLRQIVVWKISNCRFLFSLGKTKTYSWYANCRFWFSFDWCNPFSKISLNWYNFGFNCSKILRMTFTGYQYYRNGLPKHSYIQLRAGTRALRALVQPLTVCTRAWENPFLLYWYPVKVTL